MARACGIRIGPRRYEMVVLDGSAKKHRISAYSAGELPAGGEEALAESVAILKQAAKAHNVPRDNVRLAVDTGNGAFRRLTLPFSDRAKVAQVIKFEVEGELPQWDIHSVVVDFLTTRESAEGSELLVSALPKQSLKETLELCAKAGIEPLDAEFETTAMVNAAMFADLCHIDDAQLLVHIGERSTSVVVVDAGEVRDMRVIHLGALTHEPHLEPAEEAVEAGEGEAQPGGEGEALPALPAGLDPEEAARRIDQAIRRIRRELGRTLSAARTINPISAIHVCGFELPGLIGSQVLDVPVYVLDCFDEDGGQPADGYGALVVAYGAGLRGLGAAAVPASLRREELRYAGTMERIEFPLAVSALLVCFFLGVLAILNYKEIEQIEGVNGTATFWLRSSNNFLAGEPAQGIAGRLRGPRDDLQPIKDYLALWKDQGVDPERTPIEALEYVDDIIATRVMGLRTQIGQGGDVQQPPSAFMAMSLVLGVLGSDEGWRPSLRRISANYQIGRTGDRPDLIQVDMDITFFAEDTILASQAYNGFANALRANAWLYSFDGKTSEPLEDGRGIHLKGVRILVDLAKYYASLGGEGGAS